MGHLLLVDNDALLKLACYGLLDAAVSMLDCNHADIRILATAKYSLLPARNRLLRCIDEPSAARLEGFLEASARLPTEMLDEDLLDLLNSTPSMDSGEALLIAAGMGDRESLLITGDKRALVTLCTEPTLAHVATALAGRVISLEILFSGLIEHQFLQTQTCVRLKPEVDKSLTNAFGVTAPAPFDSVREALASYIGHLRAATGPLLYTAANF